MYFLFLSSLAYVCEGGIFHLECIAPRTISVISASYGRQSHSICGTGGPTDCAATDSLEIVRDKCENRESCDIAASNTIFGDPCVGIGKYLEIEFTCDIELGKGHT